MRSRAKPDFARLPVSATGWVALRLVRRTVEVRPGEVRVTDRGVFPARPFAAPFTDFAGVRRDAAMSHGVPVFRVELIHAATGARFPLYRSSDEVAARAAWLSVAQRTGLPAIDASPAGPVRRANDALEYPLRRIAEAGELAVGPPATAEPSWPMRWRRIGTRGARAFWPDGTTDVSLPVAGPGVVLAFAVLIGLSGFMCVRELPGGMVALLTAARWLYCAMTALLVAVLVLMLGERRHLAVTPRSVTLCSTWFGRRRRGGITLALDAIDTVIHPARRLVPGAGSMLVVGAGDAGFTVPDLSNRQARWIGRFVMAAATGEAWVYEPAAGEGAAGRSRGAPSQVAGTADPLQGRAAIP